MRQPLHGVRHAGARLEASQRPFQALAYVIDYKIVPKRLTPGFEYVLPRRSLATVYVVKALALAAGGLLAARR